MSAAKNESPSLLEAATICAAVYLVAIGVAVGAGWLVSPAHPILVAAAADVAATIVVFIASVAFDNSSLYDPYWSVAPLGIAAYWLQLPGASEASLGRQALVASLVLLWGARLTWNWARGWRGLGHEDWRYADLRRKHGRLYWPVSFVGIHFFPTVLVFLGCLSLHPALALSSRPLGLLDLLAAVVTLGAIGLEAAADAQLRAFVRSKPSPEAILSSGLWAFSRHPNYCGEVFFWWGLYLFALAADPGFWWAIFGPIAISCLFLFVSIPMIERRMLARRPAFAARMKEVSALVPWFPKRSSVQSGSSPEAGK